jgi:hypothetical protein
LKEHPLFVANGESADSRLDPKNEIDPEKAD